MPDKRMIHKWRTNLKDRMNHILKLEEDNEQMNRQIAHYDDELKKAKKCINDICQLINNDKINSEDLSELIEGVIKKYNKLCEYSDENVISNEV